MEILASYPLSGELVSPHIGRQVCVMLADGSEAYGVIDRIHDGHIVMRPFALESEAVIRKQATPAARRRLAANIRSYQARQSVARKGKASVKALGFGRGAYPYGWSYGNYGWGAGWWFVLPLFFLTALLTAPLFFI